MKSTMELADLVMDIGLKGVNMLEFPNESEENNEDDDEDYERGKEKPSVEEESIHSNDK